MHRKILFFCLMALNILFSPIPAHSQPSGYNLAFASLPIRWDEGLPMGNGILGLLVWEKDGNLRFSLDRADLWDLRPVTELQQLNFKWVEQQVKKGEYEPVQKYGDLPYERDPAPTKIPAAALEFPSKLWGRVVRAELDLETATASVSWENGVQLETMVHKAFPVGIFRFTNLTGTLMPEIKIPPYNLPAGESAGSMEGQGLERLKYAAGTVSRKPGSILYQQPGWGGFYYEVAVYWTQYGSTCTGYWSVQAHYPGIAEPATAGDQINEALKSGYDELYATHFAWWKNFWSKSSVGIPDAVIESQYYRDIYKLGCVTGNGAPAITLQAIWTADNGKLPPWKGDFHNDLNVQMSYWPCYTGNYLDEASSLTDWLWSIKPACEQYTLQYFGVNGLNVPGVCTLIGQPIGGWIQYSMSPTTAAWMAQHFYLQWKYSMDDNFLRKRVYPYFQGLVTYLSGILREDYGTLRLPLSSSPEIHDNSIQAW